MKIGIDISSLQGPHRLRGIGYVAAGFIKNIPRNTKAQFVFYGDESAELSIEEALVDLDVDHLTYEVRTFTREVSTKELPGKLRYISKVLKEIRELLAYQWGDRRITSTRDLDAFMQLDQNQPLPRLSFGKRLYMIGYDIIPYVLEADYLWSFRTARQRGFSRKAALRCQIRRYLYIKKVRQNTKRTSRTFVISKTTLHDFEKHVKVPKRKLTPITLGLSVLTHGKSTHDGIINRYLETSWGYLPSKASLKGEKFLLFVGGADHRRRLDDLVAAFNHLRAEGNDIKLVLSGDSMQGPRNIATHVIQKALISSGYTEDIHYVGFTDDTTRDWLYENATAFVFPSVYEGFGLPVLEAMSYSTPVICYSNQAVKEVASSVPFYASDAIEIKNLVVNIMDMPASKLQNRTKRGKEQAKKYNWEASAKEIVNYITSK